MLTINIDDQGQVSFSGDLRQIMKSQDANSAMKALEVSAGIVSLVKNAALSICADNLVAAAGRKNEKLLTSSLLQMTDSDPEEYADFREMYH